MSAGSILRIAPPSHEKQLFRAIVMRRLATPPGNARPAGGQAVQAAALACDCDSAHACKVLMPWLFFIPFRAAAGLSTIDRAAADLPHLRSINLSLVPWPQ